MKNGFLRTFGLVALISAPLGMAIAADGGNVTKSGGVTSFTRGDVTKPVGSSEALQVGDKIETGPGGKIQWTMADDSAYLMTENSSVRLDEFNYDKSTPASNKSVISLFRGAIRGVSGLVAKSNPAGYKIKTPVATMGVRGTDFIVVFCNKDCSSSGGKLILGSSRHAGGQLVKVANSGKFADGSYVIPLIGTVELCNAGGCESLGGRQVKTAASGGGGCLFTSGTNVKPKVVSNCPIPNALFEEDDGSDPFDRLRDQLRLPNTPVPPASPSA